MAIILSNHCDFVNLTQYCHAGMSRPGMPNNVDNGFLCDSEKVNDISEGLLFPQAWTSYIPNHSCRPPPHAIFDPLDRDRITKHRFLFYAKKNGAWVHNEGQYKQVPFLTTSGHENPERFTECNLILHFYLSDKPLLINKFLLF
jgi:hypothetical protein